MDLSAQVVALGGIWFVVFLFSTTLHEASHALVAHRLGDPTAYHGGQVSLNPVPHIRREPLGMVIVPVVSYALGGWMFGWASAPYDPSWAARHPKRAGLMALAGPVSNLLLVVVSGLLVRLGLLAGVFVPPDRIGISHLTATTGAIPEGVAALVSVLFMLNLILFAFNLMPVPPLDGSGVVQLFLSEDAARRYQEFMRQPILMIVGILVAWNLFDELFGPILSLALGILYPGVPYR